jgi:hypothetical protein
MKLCFAYTVFNGFELLQGSINQIKDHVDEIVICFQDISNRGNFNADIENQLDQLEGVSIIKFVPDLKADTKTNELNKHNLMIDAARHLHCTHIIVSATDHYYKSDEFIQAIGLGQNYDCTFTSMYTYYKNPTWQLLPIEDYKMPFIMKIYPESKFVKSVRYPVLVDPSVKINTVGRFHVFSESQIMMHHFSMVRNNIEEKFVNAASPTMAQIKSAGYIDEFENYNAESDNGIKYFQGRKIKVVDNYFSIQVQSQEAHNQD